MIPEWLYSDYGIDRTTLAVDGEQVVRFRGPAGSRAFEMSIRRSPADRDPLMYLNVADTFNQQILVLLLVINDPDAKRYNIDVDEDGNQTHLGTRGRNKPAEREAMSAGLAPGQIRQGLRVFGSVVPIFEEFVRTLGHDLFLIEPLAYHNAIVFERYGFNYVRGHAEMVRIHEAFQPGGTLHQKLREENPFRPLDAWKSVRGRSWAIHDGILNYPYTGFQMYKTLGKEAGINTFPDAVW